MDHGFDLGVARQTQEELVALYRDDIVKHAGDRAFQVKATYDTLTAQFDKENKRFVLKQIKADAKFERYANDFAWQTVNGATVTAECQNEDCDVSEGLTLTLSAPANLTYDGSAKAASLNSDYSHVAFPGDYTIQYSKDGASVAADEVVSAGNYTATVAVGDTNVSLNFTIAKAKPVITAVPTAKSLTYNDNAQALVNAGTASGGTMQYSLDNKTYSASVPTATKAGTYTVWYRVVGDATHGDVAAQSVKVTVAQLVAKLAWKGTSFTYDGKSHVPTATTTKFSIAKAASSIKLAAQTKTYTGKALAYSGKVTKSGSAGKVTYAYFSDAKCTKAVKAANVKAAKTYYVKATLAADANHKAATSAAVKFTVAKPANPMAAKAVARTAKLASVQKKDVTVAAPLSVTKAQGKVTYAKVAKGSNSALTVNKTTGKVTVKKGTKKGTYTIKIKVTAAGNANYKAGSTTVACKVTVK